MTQIQKTILNGEIRMLLETIREQHETLNTFEGKIPILEFDIIMENVRKLYENFYLLQRMNDPFGYIDIKDHGVQEIQQSADLKKNEPESQELSPAFISPAKEVDNKEDLAEEKEVSAESDLFTPKTSSFNDKLKDAREQSLGPRFRQTNQDDIKSLININDKFLFINELFDGDYKDYTQAIDTFNTFTEKRDAFDFLDSLLKNNLWNSTSTAFIKLKEIVEKKF
jgi:hypothetical protein